MVWRLSVAAIGLVASVIVALGQERHATPPIVLKERHPGDLVVCAEYTTDTAPRQPNRSCVDVNVVREFLLRNAEPAQCH